MFTVKLEQQHVLSSGCMLVLRVIVGGSPAIGTSQASVCWTLGRSPDPEAASTVNTHLRLAAGDDVQLIAAWN